MKKFILAACIIAMGATSISLSGCKKDDDDAAPSLVGNWELRELYTKETDNSTTPPTINIEDTTYPTGEGLYIEFRANNTYILKEKFTAPTVDSGTYALLGNTKVITSPGTLDADTAEIVLNANEFFINDNYTSAQISYESRLTYKRR